MEIKISPKIKDYATTLLFAAVPVIIAYQAEIGKYVPVEYALLFTIGMGILSQVATNSRVKEAYADTSAGLDVAQSEVQKYQDIVAKLQAQIDEKQAEVDKIAGLKELDNAPVEEVIPDSEDPNALN
jgi:hypothetical protein